MFRITLINFDSNYPALLRAVFFHNACGKICITCVCLSVCLLKVTAGWSKTKQDPGLQKNPEKYCGLGTFGLINVQPGTSGNSVSKLSNEIRDYA